jgi:hypothetical protein
VIIDACVHRCALRTDVYLHTTHVCMHACKRVRSRHLFAHHTCMHHACIYVCMHVKVSGAAAPDERCRHITTPRSILQFCNMMMDEHNVHYRPKDGRRFSLDSHGGTTVTSVEEEGVATAPAVNGGPAAGEP